MAIDAWDLRYFDRDLDLDLDFDFDFELERCFLPPPSCLFTVAHAMRSAVFDERPRFFALSSM
jgi:hypothetical protein